MSKSYENRLDAEPASHEIYDTYLNRLNLDINHLADLRKRGLSSEHIEKLKYRSKKPGSADESKQLAAYLRDEFPNFYKTAGFFENEKTGHPDQLWTPGIAIPVRNIDGKITAIIIRNDAPRKNNSGKTANKYVTFSSSGKNKGTRAYQTTHCPTVTGKAKDVAGTSLRVTEGPMKADITTALGNGVYCLGTNGLNIPNDLKNIIEELEASELIISLDAGEDENSDMIRAQAKLIQLAREIGIDVKVELWDPKYGKGIDDVLHAGHADKIRPASPEEIDLILEKANIADPLNGDWYYVVETEQFENIHDFRSLKKSQFANKFRIDSVINVNQMISAGFLLVDGLTFKPGGDLIIHENGLKKLNEWQNPKINPVEGDVSIFIEHMLFLLPDEHQRNIALDWLAFNAQHPGVKIRWALVMIGIEGAGKSFIGYIFKCMMGENNINSPTNEQLHEKYTEWQRSAQMIIIEELMAKGKIDLMNKLKPIITEDTTMIRAMWHPPFPYPNVFNILAYTNFDDALLLNAEDRRYGIVKSPAEPKADSYYTQIFSWAKEPENIAALLYYFLSRDLSHFNPNARAPQTQAKKDMIKLSRPPLEEWVCNCIEDKCWPFNLEVVAIRHLKAKGVCPHGFELIGDYRWAQALRKAGALQYPKTLRLSSGSKANVWLLGDRKDELLHFTPTQLLPLYEPLLSNYDADNAKARAMESLVERDNENPIKDVEPM